VVAKGGYSSCKSGGLYPFKGPGRDSLSGPIWQRGLEERLRQKSFNPRGRIIFLFEKENE